MTNDLYIKNLKEHVSMLSVFIYVCFFNTISTSDDVRVV